jgi:hypothetical protein
MSFFTKVANWFKTHVLNVTWEHSAIVALNVAAPFIEDLVAMYGSEGQAADATAVLNEIKTSLGTATLVLTQIQAGTASGSALDQLKGTLSVVTTALPALLAAGHIKDADLVAKITNTTNLVVGEVNAVISAIPAA